MPDTPNPIDHDTPTTRSPQDARQGESTGRMSTVLGVSLFVTVLAVVGLAVDWHESHTAPTSSPPATSAQPNTTPTAPPPHDQVPSNITPTPPNNNGNN